jgi:hypothetical protein
VSTVRDIKPAYKALTLNGINIQTVIAFFYNSTSVLAKRVDDSLYLHSEKGVSFKNMFRRALIFQ